METLYAPFHNDQPATVTVNGHRVVVVSADPTVLEESLAVLGATTIAPLADEDSTDPIALVDHLARTSAAHVVVAPSEISVAEMLTSLGESLPWIQ
jgi:hypothetical protein